MTRPFMLATAAWLLLAQPCTAQTVEKVRAGTAEAPGLPDDLFNLPPGSWAFAKQLWKGNEPCTADQCEAGYTSGELVVSVERSKKYVRVVGGFRGCESVAWNELEIGTKASSGESKVVGKRIKKIVATSAKYCKVPVVTVPTLDARQLFPPAPASK